MSELRRFFVEKVSERMIIEGEEFRHAINVLRIKEGENIIILDNSGYEYIATIEKISKKDFSVSVIDKKLSTNGGYENQIIHIIRK